VYLLVVFVKLKIEDRIFLNIFIVASVVVVVDVVVP